MSIDTMTERERWLDVVNRDKPDRIPMFYRATGEATTKLMKHLQCDSMDEVRKQLHIDQKITVGPK